MLIYEEVTHFAGWNPWSGSGRRCLLTALPWGLFRDHLIPPWGLGGMLSSYKLGSLIDFLLMLPTFRAFPRSVRAKRTCN